MSILPVKYYTMFCIKTCLCTMWSSRIFFRQLYHHATITLVMRMPTVQRQLTGATPATVNIHTLEMEQSALVRPCVSKNNCNFESK